MAVCIPSVFLSGLSGGKQNITVARNDTNTQGIIRRYAKNPCLLLSVRENRSDARREYIKTMPSPRGFSTRSDWFAKISHSAFLFKAGRYVDRSNGSW